MKGSGSVTRQQLNEIYRAMDARRSVKRANLLARQQRRLSDATDTGASKERFGGWHNIGEEEVNGGGKV